MRKSILIFSKLTFTLLLFTLAISSCKKEENLQQQDTSISKFNFEKKSYNDIQLNDILSEKLKRIQKSKTQQRLTDRIFNNGFTIDTLNVLQITNTETGAVNFRFNVTLDNPIPNTSAVLNVHLGNDAESTTAILTKVTYPETHGGEISHPELLSERLDVTSEEFDALSISSRTEIICWTETVLVEHTCNRAGHHVGQYCTAPQKAYYTLEEETNCEFIHHSGGGSGGSSTIPTNGGAPNSIGTLGVYTGFNTYDEFLEFRDFMGWGNSESSESMAWWMSEENRRLVGILSSIYKNNSAVSADAINAIINNDLHLDNQTALNIYVYLTNNNYSTQSCQFVLEAIEIINDGGSVDFSETIITDETFLNNACLSNVYSDMKDNSSSFKEYLQNFMGETPVAHLKFSYDENFGINQPNYSTAIAITEPPQNYLINITFNGDSNLPSSIHNKSKLIIAVAFIHEMIHAEIFRKLLSAAQLGNLDTTGMTPQQQINFINNLQNNFPGLYDYYVYRYRSNWGHQIMAQHYVDIIKNAIAEYDNNAHSQETYEAIAWTGLYNTIAWNNLTPTEQSNLINNKNTFIQNDTNTCN